MPKVLPLNPSLVSDVQYDQIHELASLNFAPTDIAVRLGFNKHAFVSLWRDKTSDVYKSYYKGRLTMQFNKQQALFDQVDEGNITAIQILDKDAEAQAFEDIKNQFFGE